MTDPLKPLVLAMARMMCAECTDCRGMGYTLSLHARTELPCPTCGALRKALADADT